MKYGIDSAYPPSRSVATRIFANGWRWSICYVGGPRAVHAWDNASVGVVASAGFLFLPTYVGRTRPYDPTSAFNYAQGKRDGAEATVLTGACGFNEPTILCLDAEYGDYQDNPAGFIEYTRGWVEVVNSAGHPAGVYSDTQTLSHLEQGTQVDFKWGADTGRRALNYINPVTSGPPVGRFDPASPPPWDAWQFAFGSSYDVDSATDSFFGRMAHYTPPS